MLMKDKSRPTSDVFQYFHVSRFVKGGMNIVDLLGILPYFASLILSLVMTATAGQGQNTANYQDEMRRIAQIFRILRILR